MIRANTNRGHLIPCCNVDQPDTLADPRMVKMLKVSKLADVDKVEDRGDPQVDEKITYLIAPSIAKDDNGKNIMVTWFEELIKEVKCMECI